MTSEIIFFILGYVIISSSDDIQPSTVVSDQRLCKSLCGYWNYWMQSAV